MSLPARVIPFSHRPIGPVGEGDDAGERRERALSSTWGVAPGYHIKPLWGEGRRGALLLETARVESKLGEMGDSFL